MLSLGPWAAGFDIPGINEFFAMGSDTSRTSVMVSDTEIKAAGTTAPELNHRISAVGIGMAQALMKVSLMDRCENFDSDEPGLPPLIIPDLVSKTHYSERKTASGTIASSPRACTITQRFLNGRRRSTGISFSKWQILQLQKGAATMSVLY
jgi:hypothetical protein